MIRPIDIVPAKARVFRALADEGRLAVLELLAARERRVGDLAQEVGQAQPTVSTHLSSLYEAGLVARRPDGRQVWYRPAHVAVSAVLAAAEEVVLAASGAAYACASPCCSAAPGQA